MVLGERNDQGLSPLTFQHTQISGCSLLISSFFRREGTIKEAVSSFSKDVWRIYAVHRIFARQVKENGYTMCESFYKRACSLLRNKDIHMKSEVPYIIKSKMPPIVWQTAVQCAGEKRRECFQIDCDSQSHSEFLFYICLVKY